MKKHGRYTIDNKPSVVFCSPKTYHELLDTEMTLKSMVVTFFMDDDECVIVSVHDLKKFLKKHGDVMKRKKRKGGPTNETSQKLQLL